MHQLLSHHLGYKCECIFLFIGTSVYICTYIILICTNQPFETSDRCQCDSTSTCIDPENTGVISSAEDSEVRICLIS